MHDCEVRCGEGLHATFAVSDVIKWERIKEESLTEGSVVRKEKGAACAALRIIRVIFG